MNQVDALFLHNNAAIYTAHVVQDWLEEQGYQVMEWLAYSPDLNPIENLDFY